MGELMVADVRNQVALSLRSDFVNYSELNREPHQTAAVNAMLDQVVTWSAALSAVRAA